MALASGRTFAKPWEEFTQELGQHPLLHGPLANIMQGWDKLGAALVSKYEFPAPDTSVGTKDVQINENVKVRVFTPPNATGSEKLAMYFHGGGYVMGSVDQEDGQCRAMSKNCNFVVVSVEYRLAPQYKYPIPFNDCVDATKWALKNASSIGAAGTGVIITGASAGGCLSLGTALRLIDEGLGDQITGVAALVPITVHPGAVPSEMKARYTSYEENAENTINTQHAMMEFLEVYGAPIDDKYASPLLHPRLKDLRKVYLTESGSDTLRDDARLMKEQLKMDGVQVMYDDYPGYPHYSWTFPSKLLDDHAKDFQDRLTKGMLWLNS